MYKLLLSKKWSIGLYLVIQIVFLLWQNIFPYFLVYILAFNSLLSKMNKKKNSLDLALIVLVIVGFFLFVLIAIGHWFIYFGIELIVLIYFQIKVTMVFNQYYQLDENDFFGVLSFSPFFLWLKKDQFLKILE